MGIRGMDRAFASHCQDKAEFIEQTLEQAGPVQGARSLVMTMTSVYLIDDEPELLGLLCDAVELAGLNAQGIDRASRFFEQITVFETGSVLVLDLQMPRRWTVSK